VYQSIDGQVDAAAGLPGEPVRLGEARALLNPGSVGQPRDGLADAAYALLDLDAGTDSTFEFRRVRYDIDRTQRLMRDAGLPPRLAERLRYGR
jgi:diadenosine tetraphosphatase ApaH/serine/threonine PP2A family protein phosphatase